MRTGLYFTGVMLVSFAVSPVSEAADLLQGKWMLVAVRNPKTGKTMKSETAKPMIRMEFSTDRRFRMDLYSATGERLKKTLEDRYRRSGKGWIFDIREGRKTTGVFTLLEK